MTEVVAEPTLTFSLLDLAIEAVEISNDALDVAERAARHHDRVMALVDQLDMEGKAA